MVILLMGIAGAGKTAVGTELAAQLGWTFLDADDDHSDANVAKMHGGIALSEADRSPWLDAVRSRVRRHVDRGENVVLACSALRNSYRAILAAAADDFAIVHLDAPAALIFARLRDRRGHFAGPDLLPGQLRDLEPPDDALVVDATQSVLDVVTEIRARLDL